MKKTNYLIIAALAAACVCASCQKNEISDVKEAKSYTLYAYDASTKTVLNSDWTVDWAEGDDLTVFNAEAGSTTYSSNCRFRIDGTPADGKFIKDPDETSKTLVEGAASYDWYVCYPWMQYGSAPSGTKGYTVATAPQQVGYNSNNHIAGYDLMAGTAYGVADGAAPEVALHHVCTIMKFTVTNNSGVDTPITGLTLDATAGGSYITGSFSMNWGDASTAPSLDAANMGSSKSYTSALTVVKNVGTEDAPEYAPIDDVVANGSSVDLYIVCAPFTIASGKTIKITISGGLGNCVLEKTMGSDMTFGAGKYNTAKLSYTKPAYVVFTETFGANTVATGNVPTYGKAGLTTAVPEHAANYTYAVTGNASFAPSTTTSAKINNPDWISYLDGAAVKIVATSSTSANSAIYIKGITVEPNTTYIFKYNKTKGKLGGTEFATTTVFKYRDSSVSAWSTANETVEAGTITQEFTTGDYTTMDLGVEALDRIGSGTVNYYPALDLFQLIKK